MLHKFTDTLIAANDDEQGLNMEADGLVKIKRNLNNHNGTQQKRINKPLGTSISNYPFRDSLNC